jgi:hypothetical protein
MIALKIETVFRHVESLAPAVRIFVLAASTAACVIEPSGAARQCNASRRTSYFVPSLRSWCFK